MEQVRGLAACVVFWIFFGGEGGSVCVCVRERERKRVHQVLVRGVRPWPWGAGESSAYPVMCVGREEGRRGEGPPRGPAVRGGFSARLAPRAGRRSLTRRLGTAALTRPSPLSRHGFFHQSHAAARWPHGSPHPRRGRWKRGDPHPPQARDSSSPLHRTRARPLLAASERARSTDAGRPHAPYTPHSPVAAPASRASRARTSVQRMVGKQEVG